MNYTEEELNFLNRYYKFRTGLFFLLLWLSMMLGAVFLLKNLVIRILSSLAFVFMIGFVGKKILKICKILNLDNRETTSAILYYLWIFVILFIGVSIWAFRSRLHWSLLGSISINLFIIYFCLQNFVFFIFYKINDKIHNILKQYERLRKEPIFEWLKKDFTTEELHEIKACYKIKMRLILIALIFYFFFFMMLNFDLVPPVHYLHALYIGFIMFELYLNMKIHKIYKKELTLLGYERDISTSFLTPVFFFICFLSSIFYIHIVISVLNHHGIIVPIVGLVVLAYLYIISRISQKKEKEELPSESTINSYVYRLLKTNGLVNDGLLKALYYNHEDDMQQNNYSTQEITEIAIAHRNFCKTTCSVHIGFTLYSLLLFNYIFCLFAISSISQETFNESTNNLSFSLKFFISLIILAIPFIFAIIFSFCNWKLPLKIYKIYNKLKFINNVSIKASIILSIPLMLSGLFAICGFYSLMKFPHIPKYFSILNYSFFVAFMQLIVNSNFLSSLSCRTSDILESHGLKTGFFGVSKQELENFISQHEPSNTSILSEFRENKKDKILYHFKYVLLLIFFSMGMFCLTFIMSFSMTSIQTKNIKEQYITWPFDSNGKLIYTEYKTRIEGISIIYPNWEGGIQIAESDDRNHVEIITRTGRNWEVPLRIILDISQRKEYLLPSRHQVLEDWGKEKNKSGWNCGSIYPETFLQAKTHGGIPNLKIEYSRTVDGNAWCGIARLMRYCGNACWILCEMPSSETSIQILSMLHDSNPILVDTANTKIIDMFWDSTGDLDLKTPLGELQKIAEKQLERHEENSWPELENILSSCLVRSKLDNDLETYSTCEKLWDEYRSWQQKWLNEQFIRYHICLSQHNEKEMKVIRMVAIEKFQRLKNDRRGYLLKDENYWNE